MIISIFNNLEAQGKKLGLFVRIKFRNLGTLKAKSGH